MQIFFIFRNNKLITPLLTASILESITRETIIEIAKNDLGLDFEERDIDRTELYIADEVFLCGSAIEINAIVNIDGYTIGSGEKGEISKRLHQLYLEIASGKVEKYSKWLTSIY